MPPPSWLDDTVPYLTASVPALGGRIRSTPDDFCVEERPLYLPCGEGEHLYIRVKKRGLSTPDLVLRLASQLHVKAQTIGVAGLKDAQAVTTQMLSLQGVKAETISALPTDERLLALEVLGRHRNRLRKGHHAGNQFRLVIRDVRERSEDDLQELFDELVRRGVPNYFGPQRQGRSGTNFQLGAELLQDAARRNKMPRNKRIWFMNAYQSHVFNRIVAKRIESIDRVFLGDWAMKSRETAERQIAEVPVFPWSSRRSSSRVPTGLRSVRPDHSLAPAHPGRRGSRVTLNRPWWLSWAPRRSFCRKPAPNVDSVANGEPCASVSTSCPGRWRALC